MTWSFGGAVYHHRGRGKGRGRGCGRGEEPDHFSDTELENTREFMGDHASDEQPRQGGCDPLLEELVRLNQQTMGMMRQMMELPLQNMHVGPNGGANEVEGGSQKGEGSQAHPCTNQEPTHMYG